VAGRRKYVHEGVVDLLEQDSASQGGVDGLTGLDDLTEGDGAGTEGKDGGTVGGGVEHTWKGGEREGGREGEREGRDESSSYSIEWWIHRASICPPSLPSSLPPLPRTDRGKRLPLRQGQTGPGTHAQHPLRNNNHTHLPLPPSLPPSLPSSYQ